MEKQDFARRTVYFGLRTVHLVESLPNSRPARVIGNQLLRAGTAVGASYRSALRGKSQADFIAAIVKPSRLSRLTKQADEIIAIVVNSIRTARARKNSAKSDFRNSK